MSPLNTLWVRVLFSWRGKGKGGWSFGLVSAAVCGEPQMLLVDGRAGCGFSVQAGIAGRENGECEEEGAAERGC